MTSCLPGPPPTTIVPSCGHNYLRPALKFGDTVTLQSVGSSTLFQPAWVRCIKDDKVVWLGADTTIPTPLIIGADQTGPLAPNTCAITPDNRAILYGETIFTLRLCDGCSSSTNEPLALSAITTGAMTTTDRVARLQLLPPIGSQFLSNTPVRYGDLFRIVIVDPEESSGSKVFFCSCDRKACGGHNCFWGTSDENGNISLGAGAGCAQQTTALTFPAYTGLFSAYASDMSLPECVKQTDEPDNGNTKKWVVPVLIGVISLVVLFFGILLFAHLLNKPRPPPLKTSPFYYAPGRSASQVYL